MTLRAAVLGGGISGLATAMRVSDLGHEVTLFEASDVLGGLGTTFPYRDIHLERFYHCILPDDDALIRLIREVGLESELLWSETRMGFLYQHREYSLNTPLDLLRFDPLRLDERVRLGLMAVWARYRGESEALDKITAADWLQKIVGQRAFEILWKPLLASKIGDRYGEIPALWLSSRLYREKNTEIERKGCLRHGYKSLIDQLERSLLSKGHSIRLNKPVSSITQESAGMKVTFAGDEFEDFDYVVSTLPLPVFRNLASDLDIDPRLRNLNLDYQGAICGVFMLEKPLSPYYWMPFVDSGSTAQGVIEMSNLMPLERSHGLYVTYLVNYTHRSSELFSRSADELLRCYRRDLEQLFPHRQVKVIDNFLFKAPLVEPIWTVGYSERIPPTTIIPGRLYMASTAHLYPRVNSWNSCCEVVEQMLPELIEQTSAPGMRGQAD